MAYNPESAKKYYLKNKEAINKKQKENYQKTKTQKMQYQRNYRKRLKEEGGENRKRYLKMRLRNQMTRATKAKLLIDEIKEKSGCAVCKEKNPVCLDFHHRDPAEKIAPVATMARSGNLEKVHTEIDKCVVLCANCHRKFHAGEVTYE